MTLLPLNALRGGMNFLFMVSWAEEEEKRARFDEPKARAEMLLLLCRIFRRARGMRWSIRIVVEVGYFLGNSGLASESKEFLHC